MKKLLLVLLLAVAAAYVYWPYYTSDKLEIAMRTANAQELERLVDFPAVRQSMKEQFKARMLPAGEGFGASDRDASANKFAPAMIATAVVDKLVESMVTPTALARLLRLEATLKPETNFSLQEKSWASPTHFTARTADYSKLHFRLAGKEGWRVVAIEMSDTLAKQAPLPK